MTEQQVRQLYLVDLTRSGGHRHTIAVLAENHDNAQAYARTLCNWLGGPTWVITGSTFLGTVVVVQGERLLHDANIPPEQETN